ncbi:MAG: hypothetical protein JW997_00805 [Actinobacteria bacterium]|nr:hypothetical protein [Actinomycetota bacterium]
MFEENYEYGGWKNCVKLSNDTIDLVATTDVGPRIIRLGFKNCPNLFGEIEEDAGKTGGDVWRLYGGTRLWHAPEAKPRTYYPDNSPVGHEWDGKALKLVQDVEKSTGLRKEIVITPSVTMNNKFDVDYSIYNMNMWPVKYSVWALSVLKKNGNIIMPQEPYQSHGENLLPVRPVVLWAYTDMSDARWKWGRKFIQLTQDPAKESPQKIGLLNKSGWAAYYWKGYLLIKIFKYQSGSKYPDYNSNMEVYTDSNILELETLGPLMEIEPGCFAGHSESWFLFETVLEGDEDKMENKLKPLLENIFIV